MQQNNKLKIHKLNNPKKQTVQNTAKQNYLGLDAFYNTRPRASKY